MSISLLTATAMSASSAPTTRDVVAVMADRRGDGAALHAKTVHEGDRDIVVDAVPRDDRDLDHILIEIDAAQAVGEGQRHGNALGDDLAGHRRRSPASRALRRARRNRPPATRRALTLRRPTGATAPRAANSSSPTSRPPRQHHRDRAAFEIVDHDEIGAPARRDEPAIHQPENARGRNAGGAIGGERRRAER